MQELEKILEEIEQRKASAEKIIVKPPHDKLDQVANDVAEAFIEAYKECQDIIRKHMNDGWIPVEERLPEAEQEHVLACRRDGSIDTARYSPYSDRWYVGSMCSVSLDVIAWRPLPEPYRPEQPETCKYTGGSCCWPIDQCGDCPNHPERSEK
mgnify:CR=1 FL=1